ncbi:MAG: class I adenylate-forming enzyme family protein [Myxococcota bacterium]|nr:class I adenylate-forming enzyme family protein [Myxococcota bacterium]
MPKALANYVSHWARTCPSKTAYLGGSTPLSWADYESASEDLAQRLRGELALSRGDRVAVLLPDGPEVHIALVACEKAGLVAAGIGPRAGPSEIEHLLGLTGARVLISRPTHQDQVMHEFFEDLKKRNPAIEYHLCVENELGPAQTLRLNGQAMPPRESGSETLQPMQSDELFLLNSTSGTTGMPKCVTHDQDRWFAFHALAVPRARLSESDIFMSVVPAPFGFGIWTSHITPTLLGAPCVVMPRFDAEEALALIEEHRVSVLAAVSTQFIMMLEADGAKTRDLSSLRVLFTGGEAVPYARAAEFEERTGAGVLQFYGSNETGAVSGTSLDDSREARLRTAGKPIPEMNLRLFDEEGNDVTAQKQGRPGCRGPTLSQGYYGPGGEVEQANRELIRPDGWMMLGDRVVLDDDGYLRVVGRIDDFIIRGGKNVSGPAVEERVAEHPRVALAAAVAMPDPVFGEKVCVYVELRPGQTDLPLDELLDDLMARGVSKETWPEKLIILDRLPRGSGGKVAKEALRQDIRKRLAESP